MRACAWTEQNELLPYELVVLMISMDACMLHNIVVVSMKRDLHA